MRYTFAKVLITSPRHVGQATKAAGSHFFYDTAKSVDKTFEAL
jgi:hypothetical protein